MPRRRRRRRRSTPPPPSIPPPTPQPPAAAAAAVPLQHNRCFPCLLLSHRMPDPRETCRHLRIRPSREGSGRGKHPLVRWRRRGWRRKGGVGGGTGGGGSGGGAGVKGGGGGKCRRRRRRRGMPTCGECPRVRCHRGEYRIRGKLVISYGSGLRAKAADTGNTPWLGGGGGGGGREVFVVVVVVVVWV